MRESQWRLLLAAAMAGFVMAGLTACAGHAAGTEQQSVAAPSQSPTSTSTPSPTQPNRVLAVAEAARALATIPVPPGSRQVDAAPVRRLRHLGVYDNWVDPSLTRTNWWVVPLSYARLVAWYGAHTPANIRSAFYTPDSTMPAPRGDLDWETHHQSAAYSSPAAVVSYVRLSPHRTAIRTDATMAARYDRVARTRVPTAVTSIDLTRLAIDGPARHPATATVTDPALLTRISAAFNVLAGAYAHTSPMACGSPVGIQYVYAVTFRWPGHTLAVDPGAPLCGIGMGLKLDGAKLSQTLEGDDTFDAVLKAALGAS